MSTRRNNAKAKTVTDEKYQTGIDEFLEERNATGPTLSQDSLRKIKEIYDRTFLPRLSPEQMGKQHGSFLKNMYFKHFWMIQFYLENYLANPDEN